jgi:hypothetical protein
MIDQDPRDGPVARNPGGEPRPSRLSKILTEHPEARPQLRRAIGSLLGVVLVFVAVLGGLLIWHLMRRAQLIRNRLGSPRNVSLPDSSEIPGRTRRPPEEAAN